MKADNSGEPVLERNFQELETDANRFALKSLGLAQVMLGVVWILNMLNIFIVNSHLMNQSLLISWFIMLVATIVCKWIGMESPYTKDIIMVALVLDIGVVNIHLTYHAVLLYVLPSLFAVQYCNRSFVYRSYVFTVISMYISSVAGYFLGICDANMAVLTTEPFSNYINSATGLVEFNTVNDNPWITIPLFYVLPRSLILFLLIPLTRHVSDGIAKRAVSEQTFKSLSEMDSMTTLYNRNKYMKMVEEYYPTLPSIGVVYWDVNELKHVNDTLGHEYGDYLIESVASTIRELTTEHQKAYRIGGDEFVMVLEDAGESEILELIHRWEMRIDKKKTISKIPISASVGYAWGKGEDIEYIIHEADAKMYEKKQKFHKERRRKERGLRTL